MKIRLEPNDRSMFSKEFDSDHIPRVGDVIDYDMFNSYQVVEVTWHVEDEKRVTSVTLKVEPLRY